MDKAQQQREALAADIEKELAAGLLSFPTFLEVSVRINRLLEDDDFSLDALVPLVQLEPLLAARLLGLANSALYASAGSPVHDLKQAVLRVGLAATRSLALVVSTSQLAHSERLGAARGYAARLWDHSIDVASWAYALAKQQGQARPDEALLAGMLHDIGQFYLLAKAADYPMLLDREQELSDLILVWNKPVTRAVLESLGVPEEIRDAIDDPEIYGGAIPLGGLADVLFVANLAAETPNPLTLQLERQRDELLEAATFGMAPEQLAELTSAAAEERRRALAALRG